MLQTFSLSVSLLLAVLLLIARVHQPATNRNYENSRWILFTAMLIFMVHYLVQIVFGIRARGDNFGALVNIIFYSPIAYLLSYASLSMVSRSFHKTIYLCVCGASLLLMVGCFVAGWFYYGSLDMPHALMTMGAVFFATMVFLIVFPARELQRIHRQVNDETGGDIRLYILYMRTSSLLLYILAPLMPLAIFSTMALTFAGPLFFGVLVFYIFSFVALGFNIAPLGEIIDEQTAGGAFSSADGADPSSSEEQVPLTDEECKLVQTSIQQWRECHGYGTADTNSTTLALRLGIPKRLLIQYLRQCEGKTFRVWLSDLRIEEVKRMLVEHPNYDNESIAKTCGFSSRTWMQNKFKSATGLTPSEWRDSHCKGLDN